MIKSFLYRLLEKRHFWRYASFSEIAELYTSRTIRVVAMHMVSGFSSVYLYESGKSLSFIVTFWLLFYLFKAPISFLSGYFVGYFGPKHGILVSNLLYVPSMMSLGLMPIFGDICIWLWGMFMALSGSIYYTAYMVDFSKVKSVEHAGKEIAFMNILEKVAIGISPIIGGLIAMYFNLGLVIWAAAGMFAVSALPLFWSGEPVRMYRKLNFRGFPWRMTFRSMFAQVGVGFDYVTTMTAWTLFVVIVIFPGAGWEIYVKLGLLSSVTIIAAIFASYAYGKVIDRSKGGSLLKFSVMANALVHVSRPFVTTPASIVGTNITNEVATMGFSMAFMRGVFDTADISGHRIMYLTICGIIVDIGAAIACLILLGCISMYGDIYGLRLFFFFAALFVLLIGTANFRIYRK